LTRPISRRSRRAGRKAAASRREKLYEVEIDGKRVTVNGSQLAGLRAAVARRAAKQSK
jgi:hypothetical protein